MPPDRLVEAARAWIETAPDDRRDVLTALRATETSERVESRRYTARGQPESAKRSLRTAEALAVAARLLEAAEAP